MNITRTVKEGIRRQKSFNPESNVHLLGLHQKMQQAYSWERFSQQFKLSQEKQFYSQDGVLQDLALFVSLKNVNTGKKASIFSKVKVKNCNFTKNNIRPQVHFAFCSEDGGLESRKTSQIIFFKRTLESSLSKKCR